MSAPVCAGAGAAARFGAHWTQTVCVSCPSVLRLPPLPLPTGLAGDIFSYRGVQRAGEKGWAVHFRGHLIDVLHGPIEVQVSACGAPGSARRHGDLRGMQTVQST